jgi:FlaG/FlaF family flagellin (archaellin)
MKKNYRAKKAVSEVVGVILLLAISISLFSIVNIMVFSYPFNHPVTSVNLVATIKGNTITIKHNYGDSLGKETNIVIIGIQSEKYSATGINLNDENNNKLWNIGETVKITPNLGPDSSGNYIVMIIDQANNQMIMKTVLHKN